MRRSGSSLPSLLPSLAVFAAALLLPVALGCGEASAPSNKLPQVGPDYGTGADGDKADSAHSPATVKAIALNEIQTGRFTRTRQFRAFTFSGAAGQKVSVYVDGLDGLDTVAHLYKVSPATGKPMGQPLASNDDTDQPGWTLSSNTEANPYSSSIDDFALPEDGTYAVVATTYEQSGIGAAEVTVKSQVTPAPLPPTTQEGAACGSRGLAACGDGFYCAFPPAAHCGESDLPGTCTALPQFCTRIYRPVCGCDGKTYPNSCDAATAGVSVRFEGGCL